MYFFDKPAESLKDKKDKNILLLKAET